MQIKSDQHTLVALLTSIPAEGPVIDDSSVKELRLKEQELVLLWKPTLDMEFTTLMRPNGML